MFVENIAANLCAKFNYDRLRNEKVLGIWNPITTTPRTTTSRTTFVAIGDPFPRLKNSYRRPKWFVKRRSLNDQNQGACNPHIVMVCRCVCTCSHCPRPHIKITQCSGNSSRTIQNVRIVSHWSKIKPTSVPILTGSSALALLCMLRCAYIITHGD